jgi:hypothetical protein
MIEAMIETYLMVVTSFRIANMHPRRRKMTNLHIEQRDSEGVVLDCRGFFFSLLAHLLARSTVTHAYTHTQQPRKRDHFHIITMRSTILREVHEGVESERARA